MFSGTRFGPLRTPSKSALHMVVPQPNIGASSKQRLLYSYRSTSLHLVPGRRPELSLVFLHGLLGDNGSWAVFDAHTPPYDYADCYYVNFNFENRRPHPLGFSEITTETLAVLERS